MVVRNVLPPEEPWTADQMDLLVFDERRACRRLDDADLMHYGRMAKVSLTDPKGSGPEWFQLWMRARIRAVGAEWKWRRAEVSAEARRDHRAWLDEAKRRVDLGALAGLEMRTRVMRCPLHDDRQASLSMDADKGLWWCFACQLGGDVLSWIALVEGLDWADALERLEYLSGLKRPAAVGRKGDRQPLGAAIPDA